jgi:DNA-directed RNA polymerase specialized sigma24 family protein
VDAARRQTLSAVVRSLTPETFRKLLDRLDSDQERAGERYEELRRALMRFFEWRSAPFPEEHTDEALDRVAHKLNEGVDIKNLGSYCYEVARLVLLESLKGHDSKRRPLTAHDLSHRSTPDTHDADHLHERRLACLDGCLRALPPASRELILDYHRAGSDGIGRRKMLAERLGLQRDALANRAQRVRNRLELCVSSCLGSKRAI